MSEHKGLSQEGLKLIACVSMLIDHIGAVLFPYIELRLIGRIAFPIYCYLLSEGAFYTRSPGKYALRLGIGALLSEIPFDLALCGGLTWERQNVMLTLLLGFGAIYCGRRLPIWGRIGVVIPFALAAQWLHTDYGGMGVALIALFSVTRGMAGERLWQLLGMAVLCWTGVTINLFGLAVPIEAFALLALIPIGAYRGGKLTRSRGVQWGFYLFYPVHLTALFLLM